VTEHQLLPWADVRPLLVMRSQGRCELCGGVLSGLWEAHHRQLRRLGVDCACNGLALHPRCHTQHRDSVHDNPAASYARGTLVHSWDDPAAAPLILPRVLQLGADAVLLSCGGTYT
jgi:hypothetical protein